MAEEERKYDKKDILKSRTYSAYRDLLSVVLKDDECYSKPEIQAAIRNYKKGTVK